MITTPTSTTAPLRRVALTALLGAAVLGLAGCASLQPQTPEQAVAQRAEARWDALIKRDFDTAWTYTQPGYRAIVKQPDYAKRFGRGGAWLGAQIHEVECQAERCQVKVRLTTRAFVPGFSDRDLVSRILETWVREDGQWWFYQAL